MRGERGFSAPLPRAGAGPGAVVLGVDPGTLVVGYGAVRLAPRGLALLCAGVLRAERRLSAPERLGILGAGLERLMAELRPAVVVVEGAFAARNVQSALRIGEGRGVVLACAARTGARVIEIAPASAKKALVGNGAAHKLQVAGMVARLLGLASPPEPLDATDALALALSFALRSREPRFDAELVGAGSRSRLARLAPRQKPRRSWQRARIRLQ